MIEDLIFKAIVETEKIASHLAVYDNRAAVFYQQAANDKDVKWKGRQFPRLDYVIDWQYNAERKTVGTMLINLWCTNEDEAPENIGLIISNELSSLFVTDETGTYSLLWNRTDSFDVAGNEPQMCGVSIVFDVISFPIQFNNDGEAVYGRPDPVLSICRYTKNLFPQSYVLGIDEMPEILRPSDENPVIYYRINSVSSAMRNQYAVAWMNASIIGHYIAPSTNKRLMLLKTITERLALAGEVITDDGSPMRLVNPLSYSMANNPITTGQLTVTGQYGVLREYEDVEPIKSIYINGKEQLDG